jgi:hypothetical protein
MSPSCFVCKIIRDGSLGIGILLGPSEDYEGRDSPSGSSYVTHWIVSVDGQSEESEVSERYLGRVLSNTGGGGKRKPVPRKAKAATVKGAPASAKLAVGTPNHKAKAAASKPVTAKAAPKKESTDSNDIAGNSNSDKSNNSNKSKTSGTKRQRGETSDLFVGDVADVEKMKNNKKARVPPPKCEAGESVRVIPMLTGKLYLYRGKNPRAEFKYFV